MRYVVDAYSARNDLYPKEPKKRALVDNALDQDLGSIYKSIFAYLVRQNYIGTKAEENSSYLLFPILNGLKTLLAWIITILMYRSKCQPESVKWSST